MNGDGEISWNEFLTFQVEARKALEATWSMDIRTLRREFSHLDSDGNGRISKSEFVDVFVKLHSTR